MSHHNGKNRDSNLCDWVVENGLLISTLAALNTSSQLFLKLPVQLSQTLSKCSFLSFTHFWHPVLPLHPTYRNSPHSCGVSLGCESQKRMGKIKKENSPNFYWWDAPLCPHWPCLSGCAHSTALSKLTKFTQGSKASWPQGHSQISIGSVPWPLRVIFRE